MDRHVQSLLEIANLQFKAGKFEGAAECYRIIKKNYPQINFIDTNLGRALTYTQRPEEAVLLLKSALNKKPEAIALHLYLATAYIFCQQYGLAEEILAQGIKRNKADFTRLNGDLYRLLGDIYRNLEKFQQAIDYYEKALSFAPGMADVYDSLGIIHGQLFRYDDAIACFAKAYKLDPCHFGALRNLASTYELVGDRKQSRALYTILLIRAPEMVEGYSAPEFTH